MERCNLAYREGAMKSQNALANGIDIDSVDGWTLSNRWKTLPSRKEL
jgi:hypothetical protein